MSGEVFNLSFEKVRHNNLIREGTMLCTYDWVLLGVCIYVCILLTTVYRGPAHKLSF